MTETTTEADARRRKKMEQVRALIDKAQSTNFPEEREAFLAKADELMTAYTIEAWEIEQARPAGERMRPSHRDIDLPGNLDLRQAILSIAGSLQLLTRTKAVYTGMKMKVIGYEADLDYFEALYTGVLLHMTSNIEPQPDPAASWQENVARLKNAGMKWERIHNLMARSTVMTYPYLGQPWERKIGVRFTAVYKEAVATLGIERVMEHPDIWRRGFISGYVDEIHRRVYRLRSDQAKQPGIELAGREDAINEYYYELYPHARPHPDDCQCERCHYIKCHDPKCTRPRCVEARKPVRQTSRVFKELRTSSRAYEAGQRKGSQADLSSGRIGGRNPEVER